MSLRLEVEGLEDGLQDATGMSIKKIVRTLRPVQQVNVRIAGHDHLAEDPLTPGAVTILEALKPE